MFNDCQVWTRSDHADLAELDECWCTAADSWKDVDGDSCDAYERGQAKGDESHCRNSGETRVSMFRSLHAWEACPGCMRCTAPPFSSTPASARLLSSVDAVVV